jgi:hypothetical protein
LTGIALFVVGPIAYAIQFSLGMLFVPWYTPILATLGVLCLIAAVRQQPTLGRMIGVAAFALVGAFEWFMLLFGVSSPAYVGPAQVGQKVPAFAAHLASGAAFTDQNLADGGKSVVLFFRGRW